MYNIEEMKTLVEKYFEGETCSKEEEILRAYFSENQVNDELKAEQDYFLALSQLRQRAKQPPLQQKPRQHWYLNRFVPLSAAASIAGLIVISVFHFNNNNADYLIVNGLKTTDKAQMEAVFHASLENTKMEVSDILDVMKD